MPKAVNNKAPKKNSTEERLRATPFNTVEDLNRETENIRLTVWRRFTEAQIIDELLTKSESRFLVEEWKSGLICLFGLEGKNTVYKISSDGHGLKLQLNLEFTKSLAEHEIKFLEGVVKAGIEGYGALYMRTKSLIQNPDIQNALSTLDGIEKKK